MYKLALKPLEADATLRAMRREARRLIQKMPLDMLTIVVPVLEDAIIIAEGREPALRQLRLVTEGKRGRKAAKAVARC